MTARGAHQQPFSRLSRDTTIHSTRLGLAVGGTRLWRYNSDDAADMAIMRRESPHVVRLPDPAVEAIYDIVRDILTRAADEGIAPAAADRLVAARLAQ